MRKLLPIFAAALTLAATAGAQAAPAHAIVRGAIPLVVPGPDYSSSFDGGADYMYGFHGDPASRYYDPTGVIPDSRYYGPPAVDLILARTLDRNHETILSHMLKCQAHYPTYNTASNFYVGAGGQPQTCFL